MLTLSPVALILPLALQEPPDPAIQPWQPGAAQAAPPTLRATTAAPPAPSPAPPAAPPAAAGQPSELPDTEPVVRPRPGNWGMTFLFGGLAPLSIGGLGDLPFSSGLTFTELGVRRVFKRVVLPISFGAGVARTRQGDAPLAYSAGVSASIAVLRGFRVWRRIAPYYGAFLHAHYIDARGPANWLVNVSAGPILGVEYFLADRVSLFGQGLFAVGADISPGKVRFVARTVVAAGGQLGLTFYF